MFKNGGIILKKKNSIPTGIDNDSIIIFLNEEEKLCYVNDLGNVHIINEGKLNFIPPTLIQYDESNIPANYDDLMVSTNTFFGDGSDGDVEFQSLFELDRDYYFKTLRLNKGSIIKTNGFRVFVQEELIFNGGVIQNNGKNGGEVSISLENYFVGGIGGEFSTIGSLGQGSPGGNGSTATLFDAPNTPPMRTLPINNGGKGGFGGHGGDGLIGKGGKSLNDKKANKCIVRNVYLALQATRGIHVINGGLGADGGGAGGGDGVNFGGGGGGGGSGGGVIQIVAKYIVVTPNAIYPSIIANGGMGENGKDALKGNCGGGGGGSGGGGGYIQLFYLSLPIESITNLIMVNPGRPGLGGKGNKSNGNDGVIGQPGIIECINVKTGKWNVFIDSSNAQEYK